MLREGLIPAHAGKTGDMQRRSEPLAAHPRSRGENFCGQPPVLLSSGSSPLTRGKLECPGLVNQHERLIPAHAGKTPGRAATAQCAWAHPRSRGENAEFTAPAGWDMGSSPLTRGKLACAVALARAIGLIPAHAGKTWRGSRRRRRRWAHPRSRGENACSACSCSFLFGSSPLTRGKQALCEGVKGLGGLIPAHAGKTGASASPISVATAHPRSRGENDHPGSDRAAARGSSPLTRGKQEIRSHRPRRVGLIPAHAGKTGRVMSDTTSGAGSSPLTRGKPSTPRKPRAQSWLIPAHAGKTEGQPRIAPRGSAHPRSRGENHSKYAVRLCGSGSSPLTRGKPSAATTPTRGPRLIPAHAGKTPGVVVARWRVAAHPRSRGENVSRERFEVFEVGSSPLTRGKRADHGHGPGRGRLIPAHAGKTAWGSSAMSAGAAHPRSRGENPSDASSFEDVVGSSPLTRGKRTTQTPKAAVRRLIPAHAGKTWSGDTQTLWNTAHPRSRGENLRVLLVCVRVWGSSPLTRGKRARRAPPD